MRKFIISMMIVVGLASYAQANESTNDKFFVYKGFKNPIYKSKINQLEQQIIISNFAISATGYFQHQCSKLLPDYEEKIQSVKYHLLTIFPTIQDDWNRTVHLRQNFDNLNQAQLDTLAVITAVNMLDQTWIDEPLIEKSQCDAFINQYSDQDAKQHWLDYYQRALPVLIDTFNQNYEKKDTD